MAVTHHNDRLEILVQNLDAFDALEGVSLTSRNVTQRIIEGVGGLFGPLQVDKLPWVVIILGE